MQSVQINNASQKQDRLLGSLHLAQSGASVSVYDTSRSSQDKSYRISFTESLSASVLVEEAERLFKERASGAAQSPINPTMKEEMLALESMNITLPKDYDLTFPFRSSGKDLDRQQCFLKSEGMTPASLGQVIAVGVVYQFVQTDHHDPFGGFYVRAFDGATPWILSWRKDSGIMSPEEIRHSADDSGFVLMAGARTSDTSEKIVRTKTWAESLRTGFRI